MATVLSLHDRGILTAVNSGASSLSFVGSGFIVLCYSLFKELRKFSFKLVFYLSLSVIFLPFLKFQDFTGTRQKVSFVMLRATPRISSVSLPSSGQQLLLLLFIELLLDTKLMLKIWRLSFTCMFGAVHFITFYVPLWGAILYNGFTYFQVIRMLNNATRMAVGISDRAYQFDSRTDTKALNRWGYYPLILIGSWAFGTINRIHDFIEPGHKIFWLTFLDVGTAGLMGLFNSIAYGLNASVRRAISERLELYFQWKNEWLHPSPGFGQKDLRDGSPTVQDIETNSNRVNWSPLKFRTSNNWQLDICPYQNIKCIASFVTVL
ncbi:hypothetical protein GOBAR_AA08187 [Gossypium barbadense]|uniref:G-protein coupled receptors family 2 profile 2 domain-containing protein n=1 Tax=Gossypium barbadense TaxID=3634 RepID=A0A2P5YA42_GOSBA|nr:hypothetical protein GOBAR_AA08187 [Gossypium barbadense]